MNSFIFIKSFYASLLTFKDFLDFRIFYAASFFTAVYFSVTSTFLMPEFWKGMIFLEELLFLFNFLPLFSLDFYFELEFDRYLNRFYLNWPDKSFIFLLYRRCKGFSLNTLMFYMDRDYFFLMSFLPVLLLSIDFYSLYPLCCF
jgi:hypothetical protein